MPVVHLGQAYVFSWVTWIKHAVVTPVFLYSLLVQLALFLPICAAKAEGV